MMTISHDLQNSYHCYNCNSFKWDLKGNRVYAKCKLNDKFICWENEVVDSDRNPTDSVLVPDWCEKETTINNRRMVILKETLWD